MPTLKEIELKLGKEVLNKVVKYFSDKQDELDKINKQGQLEYEINKKKLLEKPNEKIST